MQGDGNDLTTTRTVYFQSNQRTIDPTDVVITRQNSTSCTFNVNLQLNLGEIITYYVNWTAIGQEAKAYNISVLASSDDPDFDARFRAAGDACEIQIVEDVPLIDEPVMSPVYQLSDIDPQQIYVYPGQDVEVECNITSPLGVRKVTLCYSADSGQTWNVNVMTKSMDKEWTGAVPKQPEGGSIRLYVEAFSLTEKSSRTGEYAFTVSDLQALGTRTKIIAATAGIAIIIGCVAIFVRKRRRMNEML